MNKFPKQEILDQLPVGLTFTDAEGIIIYYNHFMEDFFRRDPNDIGKHLNNCHNTKSQHIIREMYEAFKGGRKEAYIFQGERDGQKYLILYQPVFKGQTFVGCLETLLRQPFWQEQIKTTPQFL